MTMPELIMLIGGARFQGVTLEDRVALIEDFILASTAPECCGARAEYIRSTGQFVCGSCLRTVGEV